MIRAKIEPQFLNSGFVSRYDLHDLSVHNVCLVCDLHDTALVQHVNTAYTKYYDYLDGDL